MHKSGSFLDHDKHLDLYNALMNSIGLDEEIEKGELDPAKVLKRKRGDDEDQDPPTNTEKEKKKRRRKYAETSKKSSTSKESSKGKTPPKTSKTSKFVNSDETVAEPVLEVAMDVEEPISDDVVNDADKPQDDADPKKDMFAWFKQPPRPENPDLEWNKDLNVDDGPEQTWFNDLFAMNRLKKDKITKAYLVGTVYKLLKGTCRSCIKLEYNIEQCYLALTDQLDWINTEGDICPYDLSKPLPLQGPPGHLTIPINFLFNNDLEYLKTGNKERKYTTSITKTKMARYELEGIEDMIPRLWSPISRHEVYSKMKILSVIRVKVDKQFGYGYLEEIMVRRVDQKEYTFKEGDFPRLHLNDIEDMLLLHTPPFPVPNVFEYRCTYEGGAFLKDEIIKNQRDLPRDIPIVRLGVLRHDIKRSKVRMRIIPTKTELTLEQSQQGAKNEVLNIIVILHNIHSDDGNPSSANIKQALRLKRESEHRKAEHELTTQSAR
ncbi:hypothetical protein Tco_0703218 [Tanacetum coccineum]|uniref:Uncharacterized protein n=1 Tax=Tanacetum coccineum TaxID=301880 RepID=A0ABQ4Y024_9ASTR